jgi:hypothetical protein
MGVLNPVIRATTQEMKDTDSGMFAIFDLWPLWTASVTSVICVAGDSPGNYGKKLIIVTEYCGDPPPSHLLASKHNALHAKCLSFLSDFNQD